MRKVSPYYSKEGKIDYLALMMRNMGVGFRSVQKKTCKFNVVSLCFQLGSKGHERNNNQKTQTPNYPHESSTHSAQI